MWKYALIRNQIWLPETTWSTHPHRLIAHLWVVPITDFCLAHTYLFALCSSVWTYAFYSRHVYTVHSFRGNALRILNWTCTLSTYLYFFLTLVLFPCFAPGSSICVNKTGLFIWSAKLKAAKNPPQAMCTHLYTREWDHRCVFEAVCVCARNDQLI